MHDLEHGAVKHIADGLSFGVLIGTLANILPSLASLMTFVWMCIRVWETETVQRWFGRKD